MPVTINRFTVDRQTDVGRFFKPGQELSAAMSFNMTLPTIHVVDLSARRYAL